MNIVELIGLVLVMFTIFVFVPLFITAQMIGWDRLREMYAEHRERKFKEWGVKDKDTPKRDGRG